MKYALDKPRDLSTVHVTATLRPLHAPVISALITRLFSMNTETEITEMMFVRRLFIYYALARWLVPELSHIVYTKKAVSNNVVTPMNLTKCNCDDV